MLIILDSFDSNTTGNFDLPVVSSILSLAFSWVFALVGHRKTTENAGFSILITPKVLPLKGSSGFPGR